MNNLHFIFHYLFLLFTSLIPPPFNLSVCPKPGESPVIYLFARADILSLSTIFLLDFGNIRTVRFDLFFYVLVSLFFWPLHCLSFDLHLLITTFAANKEATEPRIPNG